MDYTFYTLLFYAFNLFFSNIFYNDTWFVLSKNDTCLILWWQIITSTFFGVDKTKLFLACDIPMPFTFPCHYLFVCFFFSFCSDVSYARHGFDCNIYSLLLVGKVNGCTILIYEKIYKFFMKKEKKKVNYLDKFNFFHKSGIKFFF